LVGYLDAALGGAAERPGWAGVTPSPAAAVPGNGAGVLPAHWTAAGARDDAPEV
jgi:hypothetical protein